MPRDLRTFFSVSKISRLMTPRACSGLPAAQHRFPAVHFREQKRAEFLGRTRLGHQAHVVEALLQVGAPERLADFPIEPQYDLARRAGGREHAAPAGKV